MTNRIHTAFVAAIASCASLNGVALAGAPVYAADWSTFASGGHASGGDYAARTVMQQPNAGCATGGVYAMRIGFLPGDSASVECPGDATGDGFVDFTDLNLLLANWGSAVTPGTGGDVNEDGQIDFDDLNEVLNDWGAMC